MHEYPSQDRRVEASDVQFHLTDLALLPTYKFYTWHKLLDTLTVLENRTQCLVSRYVHRA